jgi:hypothetical protein
LYLFGFFAPERTNTFRARKNKYFSRLKDALLLHRSEVGPFVAAEGDLIYEEGD